MNTLKYIFIVLVLSMLLSLSVAFLPIKQEKEKKTVYHVSRIVPKNNRILCFGGGGHTSVTCHTAIMGGVIHKLNNNRQEKIQLNEYLNKHSVISGNSGGSWFMSLMCYSKNYYDMLNTNVTGGNMYKIQENDDDVLTVHSYLNGAVNEVNKLFIPSKTPFIYNLLSTDMSAVIDIIKETIPYIDFVSNFVFKPTNDVDSSITIGNNINNIDCSLKWSTGILRSSNVIGPSEQPIEYYIKGPYDCIGENNISNCGSVLPVNVGYDIGNNTSVGPLINGESSIKYTKKIGTTRVESTIHNLTEAFSKEINYNTPVQHLCAASGAAVGFSSSGEYINYIIDRSPVLARIGVTLADLLGCFFSLNPHCGTDNYISTNYQELAPAMFLNKEGEDIEIPCTKDERGRCTTLTNMYTTDFDKTVLKDKLPVRLIDGAFIDDTSIITAVVEFQRKNVTDDTCKIVFFVGEGFGQIPEAVIRLFGMNHDFESDYATCDESIPSANDITHDFVGKNIPTSRVNPHIFDSDRCLTSKKIFEGSSLDNKDGSSYNILAWDNVRTIYNRFHGIKAGTLCDLFVVNTQSNGNIPIIIQPSDLKGDSFVDNAVYQGNLLYEITKNMNDDVFDVVFGDEDYDAGFFNSL